jgi:hypothetical protein
MFSIANCIQVDDGMRPSYAKWFEPWSGVLLAMVLLLGDCDLACAATPMISMGSQHAIALRSDGTVLAWGSDQDGQLGSGRLNYQTRAGLVTGLSSIRSIGSGVSHSLAVSENGTVWAWGNNYSGQLGGGPALDSAAPV